MTHPSPSVELDPRLRSKFVSSVIARADPRLAPAVREASDLLARSAGAAPRQPDPDDHQYVRRVLAEALTPMMPVDATPDDPAFNELVNVTARKLDQLRRLFHRGARIAAAPASDWFG